MPENVGEVRSIRATATALFGEMGMSWWQDHAECERDRRRAHAAARGRRRTSKVDAAACVNRLILRE